MLRPMLRPLKNVTTLELKKIMEIELKTADKSLVRQAQKMIVEGNSRSCELSKALETLDLSRHLSVSDYRFAAGGLKTEVQDAKKTG